MHYLIQTFKPDEISFPVAKTEFKGEIRVILKNNKEYRESFYLDNKRVKVEEYLENDEIEELSENIKLRKIKRENTKFNIKAAKTIVFRRISGDLVCEFKGIVSNAKAELELFKNNKTENKYYRIAKVKTFEEINAILKETPFYSEFFTKYISLLSSRFGSKRFSLKHFVNNPVTLGWSDLNNVGDTIYEKTDGERALLVCAEKTFLVREGNIELFSNFSGDAVFDCEYTGIVNIFDCLCLGRNLTKLGFQERYKKAVEFVPKRISHKIIVKPLFPIEKISEVWENGKNIDGIIINNPGSYWNTNYKWKPVELQTIDFLVIPDGEFCYLMTGILQKKIKWNLPPNYDKFLEKFGIPFSNYIPVSFDKIKCDLPFGIHEFKYDKKWIYFRSREDKNSLISKGYYGNDYFIAKGIFDLLTKPINPENILKGQNKYFVKSKTNEYFAQVKFNSYVKFIALSGLANFRSVLDIASGKGQDIFTYHGIGVKHVVFVEPDKNAFEELKKRLKMLGNQKFYIYTTVPREKMSFETLNKSYEELKENPCEAVVCNFALHYLLKEKSDYLKFAEFCKKSKRVILTFFNEKKIKPMSGKFNVKINDANSILVKHHFSTDFYKEWIIKVELLKKSFAKFKFIVSREHDFTDYLPHFEKANAKIFAALSAEDKDYCGFYKYIEFRK